MKKALFIFLLLLISACEKRTVHVDSKTSKKVDPLTHSVTHESPKEVCLNGVVYYDLAYHGGNYTPKLVLEDRVGQGKALTGVSC
jgi:hypothetical protein